MSSGQRIIDGLKEAIAGDFSRVTIDGKTWVRVEAGTAADKTKSDIRGALAQTLLDEDYPAHDSYGLADVVLKHFDVRWPGTAVEPVAWPKLRLMLEIIAAMGGVTGASDFGAPNWLDYFCNDVEPLDTFNQASKGGYLRVTHDSDTDVSMAYLTDAGHAFLATPARARARSGTAGIVGRFLHSLWS